jgi:hypothetical protein
MEEEIIADINAKKKSTGRICLLLPVCHGVAGLFTM